MGPQGCDGRPSLTSLYQPARKGSLRGRSTVLSDVLTIVHEAMRVSLQCDTGAIVLFDVKAAFPSSEREFVLRSLQWLVMAGRQLRFIEAVYHWAAVKIWAAGGEGDRFETTRGIRQGCPSPPLIFAVVVDVLLRRLVTILDGKGCARAFADDAAAILDGLGWRIGSRSQPYNNSVLGVKWNQARPTRRRSVCAFY